MSGSLLTNYITIAADVLNHVFKGNTVTDRNSTRRANCAKQDTEGPPGGGGLLGSKFAGYVPLASPHVNGSLNFSKKQVKN